MRSRTQGIPAAAALFGALALGIGCALLLLLTLPAPDGGDTGRRAAIIDQLSISAPNEGFAADATARLQQTGFTVDYYANDQVTVDFYRTLPALDYDLLLVRGHSGAARTAGGDIDGFLFTSDPYSDNGYEDEQRAGRLAIAFDAASNFHAAVDLEAYSGLPRYFGVASGFVQSSMEGRFDGSIVVLMGCNVLATDRLARAFIGRGASSVIGWDDFVTAQHTDSVTLLLLDRLLAGQLPPEQAVESAMAELGPDPYYDGALVAYPDGRARLD